MIPQEDYEYPTIDTRKIPAMVEYRRVQAVVSRGWLWGLFHWRAYREARASLPALMRASVCALLDGLIVVEDFLGYRIN